MFDEIDVDNISENELKKIVAEKVKEYCEKNYCNNNGGDNKTKNYEVEK